MNSNLSFRSVIFWVLVPLSLFWLLKGKAAVVTIVALAVFLLFVGAGAGGCLYGQSLVARWLRCGVRYGWKDTLGFFTLHFSDPLWLVSVDEPREYWKKVMTVIFSGPIIGVLGVGLYVVLCLMLRPFLPPLSFSEVEEGSLFFLIPLGGLAVILICAFSLLTFVIQLGYIIRRRSLSIEDILLASWSYRYSVELGLYPIYDLQKWREALIGHLQGSQDSRLCCVAGNWFLQGFPEKSAEYFLKAVELGGLPEEVNWLAVDGFITQALFSDPRPYLAKMDVYSKQLLEAKPNDWSIKGTRGSVLIELGRLEEGKRMLEEVLRNDGRGFVRAIGAAYLAYAASLEWKAEEMASYMRQALEADPVNPILKRFAFLLP